MALWCGSKLLHFQMSRVFFYWLQKKVLIEHKRRHKKQLAEVVHDLSAFSLPPKLPAPATFHWPKATPSDSYSKGLTVYKMLCSQKKKQGFYLSKI